MIALNNGDKIRADASTADKIDYTIHGITEDVVTQLADGQFAAAEADIFAADANGTIITTIICVNTHNVAVTCNMYLKPSGGTSRKIVPVDVSLAAGESLIFDGTKILVGIGIDNVGVISQPADTFAAEDEALGKGVLLQGDDGADRKNVLVDAAGHLQVDILSGGGSNDSVATEGVAATKGTQVSFDDGVNSHYAQANAVGDLKITLDSEAVILGAGSAAIGKLAANSGVDIGDVDVKSVPKAAAVGTVADVTLLTAATTQIVPILASRNCVVIGNKKSNTSTMRIGGSSTGASRGIELAPGEAIEIETTAAIYGYNPGANQDVTVAWVAD